MNDIDDTAIDGNDILDLGFREGPAIGYALQIAESVSNMEEPPFETAELLILDVRRNPENYLTYDGEISGLKKLAYHLTEHLRKEALRLSQAPHEVPHPYDVFGKELIDPMTYDEMNMAMRLPITVAGALMPDAHPTGFNSLPVGGVLATENAVIPAAVGVDIGCRMHLSVVPVSPDVAKEDRLVHMLQKHTRFGQGARFDKSDRPSHPIMDDPRWEELDITRRIKGRGYAQLGSSGGGNHFVEFGRFTPTEEIKGHFGPLKQGKTYLAILSHSGSRGVGFKIARHFTKLAQENNYGLPDNMRNFAWFDLDSDLGQQYWLAMNLAGDYAKACHEVIHDKLRMGIEAAFTHDHHHNFAWEETHYDKNVIVHRKGATPAAEGQFGVIPGSMATPSYLVRGKGNPYSLRSSSHGAGRVGSRTEARDTISDEEMTRQLEEAGVRLIGGALDEAPQAYKNITSVMDHQKDMVDVIGQFDPWVVRMAD